MVFLILAAQYDRWSLPLSVLLALPFGTFGALAVVWLRGFTNDVYFRIRLVTLLGLANDTLVIYTTEHGDMLGNHGLYLKGSTPHEDLMRVTLVACGPNVAKNRVVDEPVSTARSCGDVP